ncbi:MAG TPA: hypothetical protein VKE40_27250 [Gemmataceae bacterium]|nr:hypothetical protein [Gemmataceae bacterium]
MPQGKTGAEHLPRGSARRYGPDAAAPGQPGALGPDQFDRLKAGARLPAKSAAGLLAYEGFAYDDPSALQEGTANGGRGWNGPWRAGFARQLDDGHRNPFSLNVREGLTWPGATVAPAGGCFDYTGFSKYFRRLATPIRLDADAVYYLSFLIRRHGPPADPLNAVAILLRPTDELEEEIATGKGDPFRRFNVGVDQVNSLFTYLARQGSRTPLPLRSGEVYLMVAKIAASRSFPDQAFVRVYAADEPIDLEEPG